MPWPALNGERRRKPNPPESRHDRLGRLQEHACPRRPAQPLERVKLGITNLLDRVSGDRLGLIAFSGTAFLLPPNPRSPSLCQDSQRSGDRNHQDTGHQLGRSIEKPRVLFRKMTGTSSSYCCQTERISKGRTEAGQGSQGSRHSNIHDRIGSPEGARIPMDPLGQPARNFLRDPQGKTVISQMDQRALKTFPTRPEVNTMQWVRQGKDWARSSSCFSPLGKRKNASNCRPSCRLIAINFLL